MAATIKLNGILVTGRVEGLRGENANFTVTKRKGGPDSTPTQSYSSELVFYDDGYDLLKAELIDASAGFNKEVTVEIFDDCCKGEPVFVGVIRGDSIDWCEPKCFVAAQVFEKIADLNCIQSTLIADDHKGFFSEQEHPKVRYCVELRPQFLHLVVIILVGIISQALTIMLLPLIIIVAGIISAITLIVAVLDAICSLIGCEVGSITVGGIDLLDPVNEAVSWINDAINLILGCGRFHPSPLLRKYIENVCDKCSLTFDSSILTDANSPYYNTLLFSAPVEKGRSQNSTDGRIIQGNEPLLTLEQLFLEYLNPTFNGKFEIVDGVLKFERKDFFGIGAAWINTVDLLKEGRILDGEICFNWLKNPRPAFGRFEYSLDAVDYIGNESKERFNDIVEWNPGGSAIFKGEHKVTLPFATPRFRGDRVNGTVMDYFLSFAGGIFNTIFGGQFSDNTEVLLLNQQTAFQLKLLIWETESGEDQAKIRNNYSDTFTGGTVIVNGDLIAEDERFNYPFWFKEGRSNNLYTNFHAIDDPRSTGVKQFDFSFTVTDFTCNEFRNFDFDKIVEVLKNEAIVPGEVQEVQFNFTKRTIEINGQI